MTLLSLQVQLLAAWSAAREHVMSAAIDARDDERGELTGGVILLVALAVVAAAVSIIIVGKIQGEANKLP